jgi:site-specific recombinase XerD
MPDPQLVSRDPILERDCSRVGVLWSSPVVRYLLRLAPSSRPVQLHGLRRCADAFGVPLGAIDWTTVDNAQMGALRAHLADKYSPASANRILCAVRCVLAQCVRDGTMTRDAYDRAVDVPPVRGTRIPRGRSAAPDELAALVRFALSGRTRSPIALRHGAMIALLWGGGLRRFEVCKLRIGDYDIATGELRVSGKGNKQRVVPLPPKCSQLVSEWVAIRGRIEGPLLCPVWSSHGQWRLEPRLGISSSRLYQTLRDLARRARVAHLSPHDLRRTYVGDLLDAGADLSVVQSLCGHSDPATTARYDRRGDRSRRAAVAKLPEPF